MADYAVSGPATVVFRFAPPAGDSLRALVWSPDSTRVALTSKADPADEEDIWVVFTDGRTPIRLTRTAAIERALKWSPDGNILAFDSDDAGAGELKVIPTTGGEAMEICKWEVMPAWGWSPDSKSLTIVEEGMLVRQPLSGGKAESILTLKECGIDSVKWLGWSPDGSRLALAGSDSMYKAKDPLASWGQIVFARVEGGHVQQTTATDLGPATWTGGHAWSPDGTHVACGYEGLVAVRPEGRLYEVAVDDIVERIEAGAIPATRPKAAESTTGNTR
jgi:Tol biopolymer transport system component